MIRDLGLDKNQENNNVYAAGSLAGGVVNDKLGQFGLATSLQPL